MDIKHFKILQFLSEQTKPIEYSNFPNKIKSDFFNGINYGSLLHELIISLEQNKEWINEVGSQHFEINDNGREALREQLYLLEQDNKEAKMQAQINSLKLSSLQHENDRRSWIKQKEELEHKLAHAALKDIPINAQDRKTNIIWQIIAGISIIVAFLLKLFGVKGWL